MTDDRLIERAEELGVQTRYHDVDGGLHLADDDVLAEVVAVLEADREASATAGLTSPIHVTTGAAIPVRGRVRHASIDVEGSRIDVVVHHGEDGDQLQLPDELPYGCHEMEFDTDRGSGATVVVVAPARMPRDPALAGTGSLFVPTYAMWERDEPLPSFRHLHRAARSAQAAGLSALSTLPLYATWLDDPFDPSPYSPISRLHWNEVYLDDAGLPPAPVPDAAEHVDWRALAARRRRQLVEMAALLGATEQDQLTAFVAAHPDVGAYARFRARIEADGDLVVEQSHVLAQYLADQQLGAIAADPDAAALALDLPIGSSPVGYEVWAEPTMFADSVAVGAPPDSFFAEGQNWGFPPPLPAAMHASGHRLWRQLIARVGRYAQVLRIDHAMAIERLWWVPDGFSADRGVYVRYPREELLAVIAASATAAGLTIVGENLGTVPEEVSDAFERWDVLGMYEEQFQLDDDPLPHIPARTVAGIRTHDMEPLAHLAATTDTSDYRRRLGQAHGRTIGSDWDDVVDEMLIRLGASDAYLVVADLDDLVGEVRPHNLPGRVVEGLWGRRLDRPTSEILADPDVQRRLSILSRSDR